MRMRLITLLVTTLGLLTVSVSVAQKPPAESSSRPLDPSTVAVRLILGIGDPEPLDWSGRVTIDKGEVLGLEGVRFRDGDRVTGRDSWTASTHLIRREAVAKKAAARAKAKAKRQAVPRATGPTTFGPTVTPNGVILSLKDAAGATLAVETDQGRFELPIDGLADGSAVSLLNGRVRAQRAFPHAPLWEGPYQQDFPAAAPSSPGPGAWVAAVWHEPRGPELLPALFDAPTPSRTRYPKGEATRSGSFPCRSREVLPNPASRSMSPSPVATSGGRRSQLRAMAPCASSGPRIATASGTCSAALMTPGPNRSGESGGSLLKQAPIATLFSPPRPMARSGWPGRRGAVDSLTFCWPL